MNTLRLIKLASELNIPVYDFKMQNKKAFCVENSIAIDFDRMESDRECKAILSEELGHVICGAMYHIMYCCDKRLKPYIEKQETIARAYAARLQVPLYELEAVYEVTKDDHKAADLLDVDVSTLRQAAEYYRGKGLIA